MKKGSPSATAELVCSWRALETTLPPDERILDDPYAMGFLGTMRKRLFEGVAALPLPARRAFLRRLDQVLQGAVTFILARHRAIDDLIQSTPSGQVVLLGAGYDTRPARLCERLRESVAFEVDHPDTAQRKAELAPVVYAGTEVAPMRGVTVDFAHESTEHRLLEAGLDASVSTIWVWEGVSMYLPEQAVRGTLEMIARLSGPGSLAVCDVLAEPRLAWALPGAQLKMLSATMDWIYSEPFLWHCREEQTTGFFSSCGLSMLKNLGLEELIKPGEKRFSGWLESMSPSLRLIFSEPIPK